MLNRRNRVLAALLVAAACGVAVFTAAASQHMDAEPSATALAGSSVAASMDGNLGSNYPRPLIDRTQLEDGPKPKAFSRLPRATDTPLAEVPQLTRDVRRIATAGTLGVDHAVYVGKNPKDFTCVVLQEGLLGRGGSGCNPSRNPFLGSTVMWSSAHYNEDPQKLVVFGVVTERVGAVSLTFDGGVRTAVALSEDGGFIYVVAKPLIGPSDVPRAINTFDSKGNLIEQTELGITFGP